jgi:hypothetical protein
VLLLGEPSPGEKRCALAGAELPEDESLHRGERRPIAAGNAIAWREASSVIFTYPRNEKRRTAQEARITKTPRLGNLRWQGEGYMRRGGNGGLAMRDAG